MKIMVWSLFSYEALRSSENTCLERGDKKRALADVLSLAPCVICCAAMEGLLTPKSSPIKK